MSFKGLNVDVSGDSGSAVASLETVKIQLQQTGREANDAQDSMEELGDATSGASTRMLGLSAAAGTSAGALGALGAAGSTASTSVLSLGTSAATVSAALGGIALAAAPLAATLAGVGAAAAGLAGAFGAVVGTGLIAFGEKRGEQNKERLEQVRSRIGELEALKDEQGELTETQQEELKTLEEQEDKFSDLTGVTGGLKSAFGELKDELAPLLIDFGEQFVPLIEDAFAAIPTLTERILDALGPMGAFKDALRDAGQTAMDVIPDATETLADLARDSLPQLRDLSSFLLDNAKPAFDAIMDTTRDLGPRFVDLGRAAANAAPTILDIGTGLMQNVIPAVSDAIRGFDTIITRINDLVNSSGVQEFASSAMGTLKKLGDRIRSSDIFKRLSSTVENDLSAVATAIQQAADGDIQSALGTLGSRVQTRISEIATFIAGENGQGGLLNNAIDDVGEYWRTGGTQEAVAGMRSVRTGVEGIAKDLQIALVGPSGQSGILNNALKEHAKFMEGSGSTLVESAADEIKTAIANTMRELGPTLLGEGGSGGIVDNAIGAVATYLRTGATTAIEEGFQAIGEAIRFVLLDIKRAIVPGEDSIIAGAISDFGNWLINDAPGDIAAAVEIFGELAFEKPLEGLVQGLVGDDDATLRSAFLSMGDFFKNALPNPIKSGVQSAFGYLLGEGDEQSPFIQDITGGLNYLIGTGDGTLVGDIIGAFTGIGDAIGDAISGALNDALGLPFEETIGKVKVKGETIFEGQTIRIPALAEGGIVDEPTLSMVGEEGAEAVVPLDKLDQMAGGMGQQSASMNPDTVAAGFDQSQLAQEMTDTLGRIDEAVRQDGTVRVREADLVRGLQRIFDRNEATI